MKKFPTFLACLALAPALFASAYFYPKAHCDVIGQLQLASVGFFDTVTKIDQQYDVGYNDVVEANPGYNVDDLSSGEQLLIPTRFILPSAPHKGIVVNLAEMRLYYFDQKAGVIFTYPVGIGKQGELTPLGKTMVVSKKVDPTWTPTPDARKQFKATYGFDLPDKFPPGPENPLGQYAMRLGFQHTNILIHGTNDPAGIGKRVSAGCVRMANDNVGELFDLVYAGVPVTVVNEPYKAGWDGRKLLLEAHPPLKQKPGQFMGGYRAVLEAAANRPPHAGKVVINWKLAGQVAHLQLGVPQVVGKLVGR
ncbi:MAG: L,D-transpeptidase [Gammaproteobacteria bacterium CG11_big_fil_rev_8_21_14_0_20_46_22]|nr:MAG: L,D-transpeptidase [Gammaproteobacteria bacterium CG12_big_fil_rev_8_21_14_0_65_46_12]PIR11703.1 MAG: L,D-transpeptidase [Gammaproteobacteria bacterium CG11_big_fil_rev_8_21_14_0_20_46_22]